MKNLLGLSIGVNALTPNIEKAKTLAQRQEAFSQTYKDWIDKQNGRFEKNGFWCDDARIW